MSRRFVRSNRRSGQPRSPSSSRSQSMFPSRPKVMSRVLRAHLVAASALAAQFLDARPHQSAAVLSGKQQHLAHARSTRVDLAL
eukprot:6177467-Pleurochrysis_carterae.AAC.2